MSMAFSSVRPRSKAELTQQAIQKMLDENHHLIQCIMDYQSKGKVAECTQYQQILHRNLVYLATIADSNQNMQSLLPAPPTSNMSMGPAGMSGGHAHGNLNDNTGQSAMMQGQMSNVSLLHQQTTTPRYSSAQPGSQQYQGMMVQDNQGSSMSQRSMGSYRSSQQGSAQQYLGQNEFYGEQYGHTQSSSEPINQQYYPNGHGEYSYQQPSYSEQSYERSLDESSQHYYEGGNPQFSQQQSKYQQASAQQPFSQQQYSSQQGYSGQPQGYGPGQGGSSEYSQYQQCQSQQYGSYRSSQGGLGSQAQRPFNYEQQRGGAPLPLDES
ncbi:calcium-responsive transactivator-like isoform X1 [Nerophis lumbriciformis]|uniref:calcium-responsive transactivator-like isoform X1 n=1 Tax=Nerophis lumbriciformis TaxID=546530 RepID=UPI002AE0B10B|nr:calcium-responsive transactivator-like isoform X1 [Nerophis lumbriciformis]